MRARIAVPTIAALMALHAPALADPDAHASARAGNRAHGSAHSDGGADAVPGGGRAHKREPAPSNEQTIRLGADGPGRTTVRIGPVGAVSIPGVKRVELKVTWDAGLQPTVNHAVLDECAVGRSVILTWDGRASARATLTAVVERHPGPDDRLTETVPLVDLDPEPESWEFGICYDGSG